MDNQPVETHNHPDQRGSVPQSKTYMAEKPRGATVMYAPAIVLDLFKGISVLATAFGKLPDPQKSGAARLLRAIITAGALLPWVYLLLVRPWHMRWGATDEEVRKSLPGDELAPHPTLESTRALTIRAPAKEVWRWLMQLGQDRGGFYSYDWLENLADLAIHSAEEIVPELQNLKVGDLVRWPPRGWAPKPVCASPSWNRGIPSFSTSPPTPTRGARSTA
jgi:hypothetical protein